MKREHTAEDVRRVVAALIRRYTAKLPFYIDCESVASAAWVAAWEAERTYRPDRGASLITWTGRLAKQAMLDEQRRQVGNERRGPGRFRREVLAETLPLDAEIRLPSGDRTTLAETLPATETGYDAVLNRVLISRALTHVSYREREVLVRYYLHGQAGPEIARELGISETCQRQIKQRALARCRAEVMR